ncbi:MAG: transposase [Caloramator sp.]|nr:transposase [Caloramator sp.]
MYVINKLSSNYSMSSIAKKVNLSTNTIKGFNNKIKVIKRIAFGYKNFDRFRK